MHLLCIMPQGVSFSSEKKIRKNTHNFTIRAFFSFQFFALMQHGNNLHFQIYPDPGI
jgi:hypothetical protein